MKLLLVDDSGTMRAVQKRCCLQLGVSVADIVEAADGQAALAQFNSQDFDLVVTNWNMPLMDGLTLLKEIRQKNKSIPVIMGSRIIW
jgi:two-component system chemotaxis response regulator CheY